MAKIDYTPKSPNEGVGCAAVAGAVLIVLGLLMLYAASILGMFT